MSSLNINDLYDTINNKNSKRLKKFDDILLKIHQRIKYHAELEQTYCIYCIPEFIFGVPLYNINDLKNYIMNTLKKMGLNYYIFIQILYLYLGMLRKKYKINLNLKRKNKIMVTLN